MDCMIAFLVASVTSFQKAEGYRQAAKANSVYLDY